MQVPPPVSPTPGAWELLSDLIDARWVVTTLIALYAAFVATFQAFIKDWWLHRPRMKVRLQEMVRLHGSVKEAVLMVTVINNGYTPRKLAWHLSFAIMEIQTRATDNTTLMLVTSPPCDPALPTMLAPSEAAKLWAPKIGLVEQALKERLGDTIHVRAEVADAAGNGFKSDWLKVDVSPQRRY